MYSCHATTLRRKLKNAVIGASWKQIRLSRRKNSFGITLQFPRRSDYYSYTVLTLIPRNEDKTLPSTTNGKIIKSSPLPFFVKKKIRQNKWVLCRTEIFPLITVSSNQLLIFFYFFKFYFPILNTTFLALKRILHFYII